MNDKHTIHEILPRPSRLTFAFLGGAIDWGKGSLIVVSFRKRLK